MKAIEVLNQQNGAVTTAYYQELGSRGVLGQVAVALFRAQKRSLRAKDYKRGKYRRAAYDVKAWSLGELCRLLVAHGPTLNIRFGWKEDPAVVFGQETSWVLYVDLPELGQVSFHNPSRMEGPDYHGEWDSTHKSAERIVIFCDRVMEAINA